MSNVIPLLRHPPVSCGPTPYAAFALARRAMHQAFQAWLATRPDPEDVAQEVAASESVLKQLRYLSEVGHA